MNGALRFADNRLLDLLIIAYLIADNRPLDVIQNTIPRANLISSGHASILINMVIFTLCFVLVGR